MPQDGAITSGGLSHFYRNLSVEREINVNARAKLDESEVVVNLTSLFFSGISHNATRHSTSHLAHEDIVTRGSGDDHSATFVLGAGFGQDLGWTFY